MHATAALVFIAAILANHAAPAAEAEQRLAPVIVEGKASADRFADLQSWNRELEDALQRAKLKRPDELTEHDRAQILIVEKEMPQLKQALNTINEIARRERMGQVLTTDHVLRLARAYTKVEAILENIPDGFMPVCKMVYKPEHRNKIVACGPDLDAYKKTMTQFEANHSSRKEH